MNAVSCAVFYCAVAQVNGTSLLSLVQVLPV